MYSALKNSNKFREEFNKVNPCFRFQDSNMLDDSSRSSDDHAQSILLSLR